MCFLFANWWRHSCYFVNHGDLNLETLILPFNSPKQDLLCRSFDHLLFMAKMASKRISIIFLVFSKTYSNVLSHAMKSPMYCRGSGAPLSPMQYGSAQGKCWNCVSTPPGIPYQMYWTNLHVKADWSLHSGAIAIEKKTITNVSCGVALSWLGFLLDWTREGNCEFYSSNDLWHWKWLNKKRTCLKLS